MKQVKSQSPVEEQINRNNSQGQTEQEDKVLSNKSSPGKIQSSQKEVDEFFDNFQQQVQIKYSNFGDAIQECDTQVQKCLTKIFEKHDEKQKKYLQRAKTRPPQVQKQKKFINLNNSKNVENYKGIDAISTIQSPDSEQKDTLKNINAEITTNEFLETNISNTATETDGSGGIKSKQRIYDTIKKMEENSTNIPFICNGMSNLSQLSSRYKAISYILETVPCQFNKVNLDQRNNCNSGDNILNIRNHKFERQRILSNETRRNNKSNNQIKNINFNNNKTHNQSSDVVRHHYLDFISEKENQQQIRQQNFIQNLRNIYRVVVENPNQNKQEEQTKNLQLIQDSIQNETQRDVIQKQNQISKQLEMQKHEYQIQNGYEEKIQQQNQNQQDNSVQRKYDNKQGYLIKNNNIKEQVNKIRSFRSAWTGQMRNNINYRNDNTFRLEGNDNLSNSITNQQRNKLISNSNEKSCKDLLNEPIKQNLGVVKSHQVLKQLQSIQSQQAEEKNFKKTEVQQFKESDMNSFGQFNTQVTLDFDTQTNFRYRGNYQYNETSLDKLKQNCVPNKPQKKVVIKISKESVFSKIIEEQNEKQTLKRETYTQQILPQNIDKQTIPKQRSLEKKCQSFQNQNIQIYQDQSLLQSYLIDTQSLQQRVKSFKFPKEINNKIENSKEKIQQLNLSIMLQDKENMVENILNRVNQTTKNNIDQIQQLPQKIQFKSNNSFYNKNRSFQNEGKTQETLKNEQNLLETQKTKEHQNQPYLIQNNRVNKDDTRNAIFSKKSTSPLQAGNSFFKNRLQSPSNEVQKSEKIEIKQIKNINGSFNNYGQVLKNLITTQSDEHLLLQQYSKQSTQNKDLKKLTLTSNNTQRQFDYQNKQESICGQITSTESLQSNQQQNNVIIQANSTINQFNKDSKSYKLAKQCEQAFFNNVFNPNKLKNTKKNKINFRLNRSIQDMIIQNIEEFQEKIVRS